MTTILLKFKTVGVCAAILACATANAQDVQPVPRSQLQMVTRPPGDNARNPETAPAGAAAAQDLNAQPSSSGEAANREIAGVEKALRMYTETFNKHDAAATAAMWSLNGSLENHVSGLRLEGRAAIQSNLSDLIERFPGIQLTVSAERVRLIFPDVAKVNGRAMVSAPGADSQETEFSAILTRRGGQWLLDTVEETDAGSTARGRAALKELEWLVGAWRDQPMTDQTTKDPANEINVETNIQWARGGSMLIWAYRIQIKDQGDAQEGTQVIAWDPRSRQIRSWTFESDGSFGEGVWSRSGDEWLARLTYTSACGELATATQILTKINNNRFMAQMVGLEVDGSPMPSLEPVMVVRASASDRAHSDGK